MAYLVLVDSYSGWLEMDTLHDLSSRNVVKKMKRHFSVHGNPNQVTSDNGPQFSSKELTNFAMEWSFKHLTSSPHYPQSNGMVENAVNQAKKLLDKTKKDQSDLLLGLLNLRNIPRDTNLGSPAQRLLSRRTRAVLPISTKLLKPAVIATQQVSQTLKRKRLRQKLYYDKHAKPLPPLHPQQVVRLQTHKRHDKLGIVMKPTEYLRSYIVQTEGKECRRNRRHLLAVHEPNPEANLTDQDPSTTPVDRERPPNTPVRAPSPISPGQSNSQSIMQDATTQPSSDSTNASSPKPGAQCQAPVITRSGRVSKPNPKYLDYAT